MNEELHTRQRILAAMKLAASRATTPIARATVASLFAAVIGHYLGLDMRALAAVPVVWRIIDQIGPNVVADMFARIAFDKNLTAEQIAALFEEKAAGLASEQLPGKREFFEVISQLRRLSEADRDAILAALSPLAEELAEINEAIAHLDRRSQRIEDGIRQLKAEKHLVDQEIDLEAAKELLTAMPTEQVPAINNLSATSRIAFHPNPHFTGRQDELLDLARSVKSRTTTAISGPGGYGKTQLAVEFAHRFGKYFQGGIFWLNFGDPGYIQAEIAACGLALGLWAPDSKLELDVQVALTCQAWQSSLPRLLIFDNCEEEELLQKWRPKSGESHLIVTTRRGRWNRSLDVVILPLNTLARTESVKLLQSLHPAIQDSVAEAVAAELGDLPFALTLAGSFIHEYANVVSPEDYLQELRKPGLLMHPSLTGRGSGPSPTHHDLHLGRTFLVSFERLAVDDPVDIVARVLLAHAACFAPGVPLEGALLLNTLKELPEVTSDPLLANDALHRLTGLGLLEAVTSSPTGPVKMHRLIAAFTQDVVGAGSWSEAQARVESSIAEEAERILDTGDVRQLMSWSQHLLYITSMAGKRDSEEEARLVGNVGGYWELTGRYIAAVSAFNLASVLTHANPDATEVEKAIALDNLASALHSAGENFVALELHEQAADLFKSAHHINDPDIRAHEAIILNNLANVYASFHSWKAAQKAYERAIAIHEETHGPEHRLTTMVICGLANVLCSQGDLDRAQLEIERALAIDEAREGGNELDIARDRYFLGTVFMAKSELQQAKNEFKQALVIDKRVLGSTHPNVGRDFNGLGVVFLAIGDAKTAYRLFVRALTIAEHVYGPIHANVATALNNVARSLYDSNKQEAAHAAFSRALRIKEVLYGPQHPLIAIFLVDWGRFLHSRGDLYFARIALEQALAIDEAAYDRRHPEVANDLVELGRVLRDLGDTAGAQAAWKRALRIYKQSSAPGDPRIQLVRDELDTLKGVR